eukprot:2482200-Pleurochrysis_carterae.AAC.2
MRSHSASQVMPRLGWNGPAQQPVRGGGEAREGRSLPRLLSGAGATAAQQVLKPVLSPASCIKAPAWKE